METNCVNTRRMRSILNPRGRLAAVALVLFWAVLLAGAGSGLAASTLTSWSAPDFSFGNSNYNTSETILGPSNVASLKQQSSFLLPSGALQLSNILSVGTAQYVEYDTENAAGTQFSEHVTAINLTKNKAKWTSTTNVTVGATSGQPGPIAYSSGTIYASAYDHLDAINATTGAVLWSFMPTQQTGELHLEAVASGTVFIRDGIANQTIDAVNASTGAMKWTFPTGEPIQNAAYASGVLYIGSGDGAVYAVNSTTGVQKWMRYNGGSPFVAVVGGTLYITYMQNVNALRPSDGHVIWARTLTAYNQTPMIIVDGGAFFSDGWDLEALSLPSNGLQEWDDFGSTPGNCNFVGANGVIYCADHSGNVVAYAASTGQSLWSASLPGGITAGPIVVNGCVYVGTASSGRDQLLSYCT